MHRLPELLVGLVALLVLCGLLFFALSSDSERSAAPKQLENTAFDAVLAPLQLPSLSAVAGSTAELKPGLRPPLLPQPSGLPMIALVIDDCGIAEAATRAAIALPSEVSLTFLPYGAKSKMLAKQAVAEGHDVLLHMPMQPEGGADPGPDALTTDLSAAEITRRLQNAFAAMPPVLGLNNHMGSRFTSDAAAMVPVIMELRRRNLLFLDSVTSAKSVAATMAREAGLPTLARDIFLDDTVTEEEVERQMARAEAVARRHGSAIAIGHPHPSTLKVLRRWIAEHKQRGFQMVSLRTVLAARASR